MTIQITTEEGPANVDILYFANMAEETAALLRSPRMDDRYIGHERHERNITAIKQIEDRDQEMAAADAYYMRLEERHAINLNFRYVPAETLGSLSDLQAEILR